MSILPLRKTSLDAQQLRITQIPFSGVRNSCVTIATNRVFA